MQIADVQEQIDHELVSSQQIERKIRQVAAQVSHDYQGRRPLL
ncbi:hypoxanthine phosphoribosyltransferase, partial [Bacillus subtilis]|nr:hypoxanthine phosphoribosyltransferase [Bacillus subtilis]